VLKLKEKIAEEKGTDYAVDNQKLIYAGKLAKSNTCTLCWFSFFLKTGSNAQYFKPSATIKVHKSFNHSMQIWLNRFLIHVSSCYHRWLSLIYNLKKLLFKSQDPSSFSWVVFCPCPLHSYSPHSAGFHVHYLCVFSLAPWSLSDRQFSIP